MKKSMNLYKMYQNDSVKQRSFGSVGTAVVLLVVLALIMVVFGLSKVFERSLIRGEINTLENYVNNPATIESFNKANAISLENANLKLLRDSIDEVNQVFDEKKSINSYILSEILVATPDDLRIDALVIVGAEVQISFSSKNAASGAEFIRNLKDTSILKDVSYEGYERVLAGEDNVRYNGTATAVLRGSY